jgi:hypothetical protein
MGWSKIENRGQERTGNLRSKEICSFGIGEIPGAVFDGWKTMISALTDFEKT